MKKSLQIEDFLTNDSFQRFVMDQNNDDTSYWQQWLAEHPENENEFNRALKIGESLKNAKRKEPNFNIDVELGKLLNTIKIRSVRKIIFFNPDYLIWKMAAILIIAFGLGWYFKGSSKQVLSSEEISYSVIKAPLGAKSNITLPDGSQVCLNAGSTLKYSSDFNKISRDVYLEGEAFFDIAKNAEKPFNVNTSDIDIKVLGTAFNVKAYPDEGTIETTIIRGSVNIIRAGSQKLEKYITLKVNQKATFIKSMNKMSLSKVDSINHANKPNTGKDENISQNVPIQRTLKIDIKADVKSSISWTNGILIFKSETLESIAKKLERKYNVSIIFDDAKLKNLKYTGTLKDLTLEQVLQIMKYTSPIEFKIVEKTVFIKSK